MDDLLKLFSIVNRQSFMYFSNALKDVEIKGKQTPYLMCIAKHEGCSQDTLVKILHVDKGSVAKTVKNFEGHGFVIRKEDPNDKRGNQLFLTEKSKSLVKKFSKIHENFGEIVFDGMSEKEKKLFEELLGKAAQNLLKETGCDVCCQHGHAHFEKNYKKGENI